MCCAVGVAKSENHLSRAHDPCFTLQMSRSTRLKTLSFQISLFYAFILELFSPPLSCILELPIESSRSLHKTQSLWAWALSLQIEMLAFDAAELFHSEVNCLILQCYSMGQRLCHQAKNFRKLDF